MPTTNIEMLQLVAHGLTKMKDEVVFIGGSVAELYAHDPELSDIRTTLDVDCIIEISSYMEYSVLEEELRALGFQNDRTPNAPICRKIYRGVVVDIMPTNQDILGFTNIWYQEGIKHKIKKALPNATTIYVLPVEYYIATKFAALENRGGRDIRGSHDLEDIVYIMDNVLELQNSIIQSKNNHLRTYLKEQCAKLLQNNNIREIIYSSLPYLSEEERVDMILDIIKSIASLSYPKKNK